MSKNIIIIITINSHKKCLNNNKIKLTIIKNRSKKALTAAVIDNNWDNKMNNCSIYKISCTTKSTFLMEIMFKSYITLFKTKKMFKKMNQFYKKLWSIYLMRCFRKILNLLKHI